MRISAKSKYALQAMVYLCQTQEQGKYVTVLSIAENFQISKIFLEQVFSALKKAGLLRSAKGALGGYVLSRLCTQITAYDILSVTETSLFENTEAEANEPQSTRSVTDLVCGALDKSISESLSAITLKDLADESSRQGEDYMYYL
ncbi:MAG: Rrf2 family transcriptional regulator [Oscillospiraceae bacterium]|jgi:Rrf2 family protein|nr:Rrf2 family transcriptional regulator [Oscillospiraceae bacterium]